MDASLLARASPRRRNSGSSAGHLDLREAPVYEEPGCGHGTSIDDCDDTRLAVKVWVPPHVGLPLRESRTGPRLVGRNPGFHRHEELIKLVYPFAYLRKLNDLRAGRGRRCRQIDRTEVDLIELLPARDREPPSRRKRFAPEPWNRV